MTPAGIPPQWEYLTVFLSGTLDFPEKVSRDERLAWAGVSITQQLNERAAQGWEMIDINWLSDTEVMCTFKRVAITPGASEDDHDHDHAEDHD